MLLSRRTKVFKSRGLAPRLHHEINDRQEKVPGSDLQMRQAARLAFVGAGGIGSHAISAAMKKGYRFIEQFDDDVVDLSNLTRQLYDGTDVGHYKTHATGRRLKQAAIFPLNYVSHPFRLQECFTLEDDVDPGFDLIIAGVDNNPTRRFVTLFGINHSIPVIHVAIGRDANALCISVQEPEKACWACQFPQHLNNNEYPCGLPSCIDGLAVACGLIMHAADSLITDRPREWNFRQIYMDGGLPDQTRTIDRRPDCPLCSKRSHIPEVGTEQQELTQ